MMPRLALIVAVTVLVLIGIVMVFSASTVEAIHNGDSAVSYVVKQTVFAAVGTAFAALVYRCDYRALLGGWAFWAFWGICALLLLAVPFIGTNILGATRWIYIGGFSLQPTEFAKIMLVAAGAKLLYEMREEMRDVRQTLLFVLVLVLLPLAFLYKTQSDMGSAVVIFVGLVAVMWLGEVPTRYVGIICLAVVLIGALGIVGYRADRVAVWLNPWSDQYGDGYQMIRSFYAFSEGGLIGVGLGNSREKFLYLPEAETDFIFSIIGEELGLLGTLLVVVLFLVVLYCGLRIAQRAAEPFGAMLAGGLTCMLVGQAFLNMACATGLFPTTGKPLPFISSGGSSIMASLLMVGIILSVSRVAGEQAMAPQRSAAERRRANLNFIRVEDAPARDASRPSRATRQDERASEARPARQRRARGSAFGGVMAPRSDAPAARGDSPSGDSRGSQRRSSRGSSRAETPTRASARGSRRTNQGGRRGAGRSIR